MNRKRCFDIVVFVCLLVAACNAGAQQHAAPSAAELLSELKKLPSTACVLYVAAHPDDENTRLLAWLARGRSVRTVYLSLTRGDGGQNILGPEQGAALGLIRTHELLEARRLDGAEQLFSRAIDFGFSKSADETFKHWDRTLLIADVVRAIQYVKPDIVICRFPKDSMAGHGQHSASAIIAEDAVNYCYGTLALQGNERARLDSMLAQDTDEYTAPWRPTRLLFNAFRFGNRSTIEDSMVKLLVGQYDAMLGLGYGELAGKSRSIHRSQGAGTPSTPGIATEYFSVLAGAPIKQSIFDGIDTTWLRYGLPNVSSQFEEIIRHHQVEHPEVSIPALLAIQHQLRSTLDSAQHRIAIEQKLTDLTEVIVGCMGLVADVTVPEGTALPGATLKAQLRLTQRSGDSVTLVRAAWQTGSIEPNVLCASDVTTTLGLEITVPTSAKPTNPYWLEKPSSNNMYAVSSTAELRNATTVPCMPVTLWLAYKADTIPLVLHLSSKRLDPTHGDVIEPLRIIPPVSLRSTCNVIIAEGGKGRIGVEIHAYRSLREAAIRVKQGINVVGKSTVWAAAGTDTLVFVDVTNVNTGSATLECIDGNDVYSVTLHEIRYEHIPTLQYLGQAEVNLVAEPIVCKAKHIGFISGAGDQTAEALGSLGVIVEELTDNDLVDVSSLGKYDAIVVGVRAINVRKKMKQHMPVLLDYVYRGGTLLMQYNTTQDMSTRTLGPWPFELSRDRVTEEDAPVTLLQPAHPLLNYPNRIRQDDFNGWVQERGLYFPTNVDAKYTQLLSMADESEEQHSTSLLYGSYGKGHYVYCSLSLFRELPAGVVGAYKMLANMTSVGK